MKINWRFRLLPFSWLYAADTKLHNITRRGNGWSFICDAMDRRLGWDGINECP